MFNDRDKYTIETFGTVTTVRVDELLGPGSENYISIEVRGDPKTVREIPHLDIYKVIRSQDHRDNVKVYVQKRGEEQWHLCYPKRRG